MTETLPPSPPGYGDATHVTLPIGSVRAAALALRSYQNGNAATALAAACAAELERFVGAGLMPPAPAAGDPLPQDPEAILAALIGDLHKTAAEACDHVDANRSPERLARFMHHAMMTCGAAMAMLSLWRRRNGR